MSALPLPRRTAWPASLSGAVWRADALAEAVHPVLPSGHATLDAQLPGGGWPLGGLCEILQATGQHQEWRLLLSALARSGNGAVVLVGPPLQPFAPSLAAQGLAPQRLVWLPMQAQPLAQRLWAAEQALRCAEVDAVLLWLPDPTPSAPLATGLRRLQLAVSQHPALAFVLRPQQARHSASAAILRLLLRPAPSTPAPLPDPPLLVEILKRRGPALDTPITLPARPAPVGTVLAAAHTYALDCPAAAG